MGVAFPCSKLARHDSLERAESRVYWIKGQDGQAIEGTTLSRKTGQIQTQPKTPVPEEDGEAAVRIGAAETLAEVLDNEQAFHMFETQLKKECNEENLNFMVDVIMFRRLIKKMRKKKKRSDKKVEHLLGANILSPLPSVEEGAEKIYGFDDELSGILQERVLHIGTGSISSLQNFGTVRGGLAHMNTLHQTQSSQECSSGGVAIPNMKSVSADATLPLSALQLQIVEDSTDELWCDSDILRDESDMEHSNHKDRTRIARETARESGDAKLDFRLRKISLNSVDMKTKRSSLPPNVGALHSDKRPSPANIRDRTSFRTDRASFRRALSGKLQALSKNLPMLIAPPSNPTKRASFSHGDSRRWSSENRHPSDQFLEPGAVDSGLPLFVNASSTSNRPLFLRDSSASGATAATTDNNNLEVPLIRWMPSLHEWTSDIWETAMAIYEEYCTRGSAQEINLSIKVQRGLDTVFLTDRAPVDEVIYTVFDEAFTEILELLTNDPLRRMRRSTAF